jgi:hypothetical protein
MGVNNANFPNNVLSETEALQYLGSVVNATRLGLYNALTGSPTVTAAQMVGAAVDVSGGTTATLTTDTAVNIIARMQAVDANAGVGSTALFRVINDNSGALTVAGGTGVTLVGAGANTIAAGASKGYMIKILTTTTVSLSWV